MRVPLSKSPAPASTDAFRLPEELPAEAPRSRAVLLQRACGLCLTSALGEALSSPSFLSALGPAIRERLPEARLLQLRDQLTVALSRGGAEEVERWLGEGRGGSAGGGLRRKLEALDAAEREVLGERSGQSGGADGTFIERARKAVERKVLRAEVESLRKEVGEVERRVEVKKDRVSKLVKDAKFGGVKKLYL